MESICNAIRKFSVLQEISLVQSVFVACDVSTRIDVIDVLIVSEFKHIKCTRFHCTYNLFFLTKLLYSDIFQN